MKRLGTPLSRIRVKFSYVLLISRKNPNRCLKRNSQIGTDPMETTEKKPSSTRHILQVS